MIENLKEKLHQGERKQSKGAKLCGRIRWELECEKSSKTFCKMFARQNMQNQTNTKHSSNSENIFKSTKNFLEKLKTKEDFSNTNTSKGLSKILTERKLQSSSTTFARLRFL